MKNLFIGVLIGVALGKAFVWVVKTLFHVAIMLLGLGTKRAAVPPPLPVAAPRMASVPPPLPEVPVTVPVAAWSQDSAAYRAMEFGE